VILGLKRVFWGKEHNGGHDESLKWLEKKKLTMGLKLSGICSRPGSYVNLLGPMVVLPRLTALVLLPPGLSECRTT
jgi:hypothetical protein